MSTDGIPYPETTKNKKNDFRIPMFYRSFQIYLIFPNCTPLPSPILQLFSRQRKYRIQHFFKIENMNNFLRSIIAKSDLF